MKKGKGQYSPRLLANFFKLDNTHIFVVFFVLFLLGSLMVICGRERRKSKQTNLAE